MKRKDFIKSAAIGTTTLLVGIPSITSCSSQSSKESGDIKLLSNEELGLPPLLEKAPEGREIKVGLIGCGGRGSGAAINFLDAGTGLKIVCIADLLPDRLEACRTLLNSNGKQDIKTENAYLGFDAYKKVLESDIDSVIIATPSRFHPMLFEAAVKAGKNVFIEKPCGVDPAGVRSFMLTAKNAQSQGLSVVCGTQRRHGRDYCETYRRVAAGMIGEVVGGSCFWMTGRTWYTNRKPEWSDSEYIIRNWLNYPFMGGDVIVDHHIHNIDVISWFMGNKTPKEAMGFGAKIRPSLGNKYDFFSTNYVFDKNVQISSATRHIDKCSNLINETIVGTNGSTNCQNTIWDNNGNVLWEYPYETNPVTDHYIQEHIDWITSIRTNKPLNEAHNMATSTLIAIMGRDSAYTGQSIKWDEIMTSQATLGPDITSLGDLDYSDEHPIPGEASNFG